MKKPWKALIVVGFLLMLYVGGSDELYFYVGPLGVLLPGLLLLVGVIGLLRDRSRRKQEAAALDDTEQD